MQLVERQAGRSRSRGELQGSEIEKQTLGLPQGSGEVRKGSYLSCYPPTRDDTWLPTLEDTKDGRKPVWEGVSFSLSLLVEAECWLVARCGTAFKHPQNTGVFVKQASDQKLLQEDPRIPPGALLDSTRTLDGMRQHTGAG